MTIYSRKEITKILRGSGDIRSRCHNTILETADGKGVRLITEYDGYHVKGFDILKGTAIKDPFHIADMNLKSPPIGFVNRDAKTPIFTYRTPTRAWKIGLSPDNTSFKIPVGTRIANKWRYLSTSDSFAKTILGQFSSFEEVLKNFEQDPKLEAKAFDRNLCITRDKSGFFFITNSQQKIATLDPDTMKIVIKNSNPYIEKFLTSKGVPL